MRSPLVLIKLLHTLVWAVFAGCIMAIPIASWWGQHQLAAWLSGFVALEVLVLVANRWTCPMTDWAARYTDARHPNFDIYLPQWLARYNKHIFGTLYVLGMAYALARWLGRGG